MIGEYPFIPTEAFLYFPPSMTHNPALRQRNQRGKKRDHAEDYLRWGDHFLKRRKGQDRVVTQGNPAGIQELAYLGLP